MHETLSSDFDGIASRGRRLGCKSLNQAHLATLSRKYQAHHIAGSFAGPDYAAASLEMRGALDVSVADFAAYAGGVPITRYMTYAELLGAYNRLFEEAAGTGRL